MSNSKLVNYKCISPNRTSPRNHAIDTITIHCMAGQCSVETCGDIFKSPARNASSNYGVGPDGRIGLYVEEKDRAWTSSNRANDMRAITIEVASDKSSPYKVKDEAMEGLIKLLVDICKRNKIKQLLWKDDKSLIGNVKKQNMTIHKWFSNTDCPGNYLHSKMGDIAKAVNKQLEGNELASKYKVGSTYTVQTELNVRTGPGTKYSKKKKYQIDPDSKLKDKNKNGALDKGSKVKCKELKQIDDNQVWMRCEVGWIAAYYKGKTYVK